MMVEVDKPGLSIGIRRGFLQFKNSEGEVQELPSADIECIISMGWGGVFSHPALLCMCEENIPLLICGKNFLPVGLLVSGSQNISRKERIETQIKASLPLKKNLWQQVVKAKIHNQMLLLKKLKRPYEDFAVLEKQTLSGDNTFMESVAARRYFKRLFGNNFKRDADLPGVNSLLNYGYAILRAMTARAIAGKGLLPELGINHRNMSNPFCLADDLMEPFRPFVDAVAYAQDFGTETELDRKTKSAMLEVLEQPVIIEDKKTILKESIEKSVQSLVVSFSTKLPKIEFPDYV